MTANSETYPLTLPSLNEFEVATWSPENMVGVSVSPFTGAPRVMDWAGRLWMFRLILSQQNPTNIGPWQGTLLRLRGPYGTFYFGDPRRPSPLGTVSGQSPVVNGAGQSGDRLIVDNAGNAKTWFAGDYFQLENNLYQVTANAVSDASGNVTLFCWPELRNSPADNAALTISNPVGIFRLLQSYKFDIEQVLYAGAEFLIVEEPQ